MTRRLRVAQVIVQPVLMWDDGDELTPGPPVQQATLTLSQLADWLERVPAEIEALAAASANE